MYAFTYLNICWRIVVQNQGDGDEIRSFVLEIDRDRRNKTGMTGGGSVVVGITGGGGGGVGSGGNLVVGKGNTVVRAVEVDGGSGCGVHASDVSSEGSGCQGEAGVVHGGGGGDQGEIRKGVISILTSITKVQLGV